VVELALGKRPFEVTKSGNFSQLQLRSDCELWLKERLLNLLMQRIPNEYNYIAWIDADAIFSREDWPEETLHQLQHYDVVQLFSHAIDLSYDHKPLKTFNGAIYNYINGIKEGKGYVISHPGYAWAAKRSVLNEVGGLLDIAILGSADAHMCDGLLGKYERTFFKGMTSSYKNLLLTYEKRLDDVVKRNVGYVDTTLMHMWHGNKKSRGYETRWKILRDNNYDPVEDIKTNLDGLYVLSGNKPKLRDQIRQYFASRNEDEI
jgi:hypothetical protein